MDSLQRNIKGEVKELLNERPRQALKSRTPKQDFRELLQVVALETWDHLAIIQKVRETIFSTPDHSKGTQKDANAFSLCQLTLYTRRPINYTPINMKNLFIFVLINLIICKVSPGYGE